MNAHTGEAEDAVEDPGGATLIPILSPSVTHMREAL